MPWIRSNVDSGPYVISGNKVKLHLIQNISIDQLNGDDPNYKNKFSLNQYNPNYVSEYLKLDHEVDFLPAGIYKVNCPTRYDALRLFPYTRTNESILFRLSAVDEVLKRFHSFLSKKSVYRRIKQPYKEGILLYGPPGTGKSSAINIMLDEMGLDDVLVFYVDGAFPEEFLDELKNDPRLKVFIFEELTETLKQTDMGLFLNFLDGIDSLDSMYVIATTNYPERLPENIANRKGRFDHLIPILEVSKEDSKIYLEYYLKRSMSEEELNSVKGMSLAFLKGIVIDVLLNDKDFESAVRDANTHKLVVSTKFRHLASDDELDDNIL